MIRPPTPANAVLRCRRVRSVHTFVRMGLGRSNHWRRARQSIHDIFCDSRDQHVSARPSPTRSIGIPFMASMSPDIVERPRIVRSAGERSVSRGSFPRWRAATIGSRFLRNLLPGVHNTAVFTSIWPGFASGYENTFEVHTLPGLGYVDLKKQLPDSRRGFIWTPPSILKKVGGLRSGRDIFFGLQRLDCVRVIVQVIPTLSRNYLLGGLLGSVGRHVQNKDRASPLDRALRGCGRQQFRRGNRLFARRDRNAAGETPVPSLPSARSVFAVLGYWRSWSPASLPAPSARFFFTSAA